MTLPAILKKAIPVYAGDSFTVNIPLTPAPDLSVWTGWAAWVAVKGVKVAEFRVSVTGGAIRLSLSAEETGRLRDTLCRAGRKPEADFDVQANRGGTVVTWVKGKLAITNDVTRVNESDDEPNLDDVPDFGVEVTVPVIEIIEGGDGTGVPLADIQAMDAATLLSANTYTDVQIATIDFPDGVPVEYVDEGDEDAIAQARSYTDAAIAGIDFPDTGVPEATIDAKDQAVREHADAGDQSIRELIASLPAPVTNWSGITGKPTTFTPAAHTHTLSQITDMPATPTWGTLGGKPTTFPPSAHQHAASDITSGVFAPARLGTGTTDAGKVLFGDGAWRDAPTGGGGSGGLTGPGRPDMPAGTGLANEIAAAPIGTLYNSTDGAGAGAWAWRKRPAGWVVVDGDTGLRRFVLTGSAFPANGSYVEYRRRQDSVFLQVNSTNAGAWRLNTLTGGSMVPVLVAQPGFRPSSGAMTELNNDGRGRLGAYLLQMPPNDGQGALQIRAFETVATNQWVRVPILTWLTPDEWPATLPGIAA